MQVSSNFEMQEEALVIDQLTQCHPYQHPSKPETDELVQLSIQIRDQKDLQARSFKFN